MSDFRYRYRTGYRIGAYASMAAGAFAPPVALSLLGILTLGDEADFANSAVGFLIAFCGIFAGYRMFDLLYSIFFDTE